MGVYLVLNLALSYRYDVIKSAVGGLEVERTFYVGSEILIAPSPLGIVQCWRGKFVNRSTPVVTRQKTRISHAV